MDMGHGHTPVQSEVRNAWAYRIFNWVFGAVFAGIVILSFVLYTSEYVDVQWGWLLAFGVVGVLLSVVFSRLFMLLPPFGIKSEVTVAVALFLLIIAAQVAVGASMRADVSSATGFGAVYSQAQEFVLNGTLPGDYFAQFSGERGLYVLMCAFFGMFELVGIHDFYAAMAVVNIIAIDVAILLAYFCARRMFGAQKAILLLISALACLPFVLYVPMFSAYTLALPFPVAMVFLWLKARIVWREGSFGGAMLRFLALSLIAAVGTLIQPLVIIVYIAIVLDLLIFLRGIKRLLLMLCGTVLCAGLTLGGLAVMPQLMFFSQGGDADLPLTTWVMMGLSGDGSYNEQLMQQLLEQEGAQARSDFALSQIEQSLNEKGVGGLLSHAGAKLSAAFGDGLYGAPKELENLEVDTLGVGAVLTSQSAGAQYLLYIAFAIKTAMLFQLIVAAIKSFFRRNYALVFLRMALFGLVLFLLVWQVNAAYLIVFLPLCLLCGIEALPIPMLSLQRMRARDDAAAMDAELNGDVQDFEFANAGQSLQDEIFSELEVGEAPKQILLMQEEQAENFQMTGEPEQDVLPQEAYAQQEHEPQEQYDMQMLLGETPDGDVPIFAQLPEEDAQQEDLFSQVEYVHSAQDETHEQEAVNQAMAEHKETLSEDSVRQQTVAEDSQQAEQIQYVQQPQPPLPTAEQNYFEEVQPQELSAEDALLWDAPLSGIAPQSADIFSEILPQEGLISNVDASMLESSEGQSLPQDLHTDAQDGAPFVFPPLLEGSVAMPPLGKSSVWERV